MAAHSPRWSRRPWWAGFRCNGGDNRRVSEPVIQLDRRAARSCRSVRPIGAIVIARVTWPRVQPAILSLGSISGRGSRLRWAASSGPYARLSLWSIRRRPCERPSWGQLQRLFTIHYWWPAAKHRVSGTQVYCNPVIIENRQAAVLSTCELRSSWWEAQRWLGETEQKCHDRPIRVRLCASPSAGRCRAL